MANFTGTDFAETLEGGFGDDLIKGLGGDDRLIGSVGDDTIYGGDGDDYLRGSSGNDTIYGGGGEDYLTYYGALGSVWVDMEAGVAYRDGEGGRDEFFEVEVVSGSNGYDDTLRGDGNFNRLFGRVGNDLLEGRGGDDELIGDVGDDTLDGGEGFDEIGYFYADGDVYADLRSGTAQDGQGGTDVLISIEDIDGSDYGNDTLLGDNRDNEFDGFGGIDVIRGRGGNDSLSGDAGNDTLDGGKGYDWAQYFRSDSGISVNLAKGTAQDGHGSQDRLISIEGIDGSDFADRIKGSNTDNILSGFAGNDSLFGGGGEDWLWGGVGDDVLRAGAGDDRLSASLGRDTLDGGAGRDEVTFDRALRESDDDGSVVVVNLIKGRGYSTSDAVTDHTKLISVEDVLGTYYFNEFEELREMGLSLRLIGSKKANELVGGANDDTIEGGGGSDTLEGAAGDDVLSGQRGADQFVFSTAYKDQWGTDTITDFRTKGRKEKIVIDSDTEADSFALFKEASMQVGDDVVYDLGSDESNVIVIEDVQLDDLRANDFLFS